MSDTNLPLTMSYKIIDITIIIYIYVIHIMYIYINISYAYIYSLRKLQIYDRMLRICMSLFLLSRIVYIFIKYIPGLYLHIFI